jgi:hypothetical protein
LPELVYSLARGHTTRERPDEEHSRSRDALNNDEQGQDFHPESRESESSHQKEVEIEKRKRQWKMEMALFSLFVA